MNKSNYHEFILYVRDRATYFIYILALVPDDRPRRFSEIKKLRVMGVKCFIQIPRASKWYS